jgi:hypothetical protein
MAGSTIDHLVSVTVFLGAMLLFISLFNQTLQTAILYQHHRYLATKCSDLLDNMLLNPGIPEDWGKSNCTPYGFGLQDPEFTQYRLSPFSLMRLRSSVGEPVYYPRMGLTYSNITMGFGNFLLVPYTEVINYSAVAKLLGINGTYGFQLTMTPIVTVSIEEVQLKNPLILSVRVTGVGFPLVNAHISYCLLTVSEGGGGPYPYYTVEYGVNFTDAQGSVLLRFTSVKNEVSYVFIVYAYLGGLIGMGYHEHVTYDTNYIIPFIDDFAEGRMLIAHSYDVHKMGDTAEVTYNATFVILTDDFTLRQIPIENSTGSLNYGQGKPYAYVTIPQNIRNNPGILVITYRKSAQETGVVLMPWGISSMAFPVVFGDDPSGQEWVATDIRQVIVNNIAYQAKLALWSLEGYGVVG